MKSRLAWFLVLTLLLSALCGATVLAEEEKIEITIWGIDPTGVGDGNAEMIAALQAAFPQYEIKCEAMPASGGYDTQDLSKLTAAVAAGDPPDIAVLNAPFIMEVASRGMLEPINAYIEDLGIDLRETFYEYTIDEMTFQGDIWGLPSDTDCRILYYNKDMFEEAGLDPEAPPTTWDQLLEYAEKLTKYDENGNYEQIGFIPNYGNSWLYLYAIQNGGSFVSEDGRTITLNAPENVEALEFMVEGYDLLGGAEKVNAYSSSFLTGADDPFLRGQVAMLINCDNSTANYARYAPDLNYGVAYAPTPTGENFKTWSGGWGYGIMKGSQHPKEATEVMMWLCTQGPIEKLAGQKVYNDENGLFTLPNLYACHATNDTLYDLYVKDFEYEIPREAFAFAVEALDTSMPLPVSPVGQLLWSHHASAIDAAIYHNGEPQDILDEATWTVQQELDTFWRKNDSL